MRRGLGGGTSSLGGNRSSQLRDVDITDPWLNELDGCLKGRGGEGKEKEGQGN